MSIETRLLDWTKEGLIGADDARAFLALEEMRMAAAEIERLRDAEVIARTTQANLHEEIEQLRQETLVQSEAIETLRDILRECDIALSFMPQPTKTLRALRERIKEALGE